jgi:acyl carrier protein
MSQNPGPAGPQFRADRPIEQESVRTTIVGGRPPGSGQPVGNIPRGIEVLVKKAAVDAAFKERLLHTRAAAADEIGLRLEPAEAMMLTIAPAEQLQAVIARTAVPQEHRRAFLGQAAAAMLATLGVATVVGLTQGSRPDRPSPKASQQPPPAKPAPALQAKPGVEAEELWREVRGTIVEQLHPKDWLIWRGQSLTKDLGADEQALNNLRIALQVKFNINLPADMFQKVQTAEQTLDAVRGAVQTQPQAKLPGPRVTHGTRPDVPPSGEPAVGGVRPDIPPGGRGIRPDGPLTTNN